MILTVTPNTGLDRVIFVHDFVWGKTIRADDAAWGMGGKATDASLVLGELGEANLATGFAAGKTGERMVRMLTQHPATRCDFVWVEGETRTNYILVDTSQRAQSTITVAGLRVRPEHMAELERCVTAALPDARCMIVGGSLPAGAPPELYPRLILTAKAAGVPVILDASGDALRRGVEALPTALKPNRDELEMLVGHPLKTAAEIVAAAQTLVARGITLVVATNGAHGLWAVTADETLYAPALPIRAVNTAGAGDALAAGLAMGLARGWPWSEGLRWGIAAAGAVCLTPGTAVCHKDDVHRLLDQVIITPWRSAS